MYPCLCPPSNTYDVTADAEDYTQKSFRDITVPEEWVVDIDFPLGYAGAVSGSVTDADTQLPIGEAAVIAEQGEEPYTGTGNEISDAGGNYAIAFRVPPPIKEDINASEEWDKYWEAGQFELGTSTLTMKSWSKHAVQLPKDLESFEDRPETPSRRYKITYFPDGCFIFIRNAMKYGH